MAEINVSPNENKKRKKLSTKVDLTPMVDLGFLLITFFVFTTTMSRPTVMNMSEPKDDLINQKPVKESGVMTILLGKNHQLFYYYRKLEAEKALQQIKQTNFNDIRYLILNKKNTTAMPDLMYIIKPDKDATYKDVIDVLDEMAINEIPPGHYAEVDISETEQALMVSINK